MGRSGMSLGGCSSSLHGCANACEGGGPKTSDASSVIHGNSAPQLAIPETARGCRGTRRQSDWRDGDAIMM